ncbi:unnamed protein product [Periconia digitata]|uniref:YjgF-like protein n=1 Tax=Periconia digitata TaxID=1303443 RepID=A0A9W4UHK7_9PLEO|nr:unnamed protein product [Periconia digitata]
MSAPTFHNYATMEKKSEEFHYSQSTIVNGIIKTSGQGGWDAEGVITSDPKKQVEFAFENVVKALDAAKKGASWKDVYAVRSYHTNIDESAEYVIELFNNYMPDHRPIWTCVEISKLGIEGMQVEIEVEAQA